MPPIAKLTVRKKKITDEPLHKVVGGYLESLGVGKGYRAMEGGMKMISKKATDFSNKAMKGQKAYDEKFKIKKK